ncbi:tetratricopeptide repeat protein [Leucobacter ruminantium]|uniref:Tetratricopeptide repeat protein n=1 Tax=Leucobacter ruminantium TaxID=1289170 RepID=A0A939M1K3_9MICO|nr:tetratricopeptide repeat protein [Leucobacter ruminantium]
MTRPEIEESPTGRPGPGDFLQRAEALADFGRPDEAIEELQRGLAEYPEHAALWAHLAWVRWVSDDRKLARAAAEAALSYDPDQLGALHTMVLLEARARDAPGAHLAADRMLQLAPDHPASHLDKARALAAEPDGSRRHSRLIRDAAYWAMSLDIDSASTVAQAAGLLHGVVGKAEFSQLISRGLALDPQNEALLFFASDAHTKHDGQVVDVLSSMLVQNPQQRDAAIQLNHIVWERTRWVPALAVWGMLAIALPQAAVAVLVMAMVNLWTLAHRVRRSAPRGFLRRTWGASAWSRTGVILGLLGASWPLLALPLVFWLRMPGLLALVPLLLLASECLIVYAGDRELRRLLAPIGPRAADYTQDLHRAALKGWVRIIVGGIALVCGLVGLVTGAGRWMPLIVLAGLAFVIPALLRLLLTRDMRRQTDEGSVLEQQRDVRAPLAVIAVCAVGLAALMMVQPPEISIDQGPRREQPSPEDVQRTREQLHDYLQNEEQRREDLERSMSEWSDSLRDAQQRADDVPAVTEGSGEAG